MLRFGRLIRSIRGRRGLLLSLLALELALLTSLVAAVFVQAVGSDDEFAAIETLLAQEDLPPGWAPVLPAAYPYLTNSPLVRLLLEEETVAGAFSAFRAPDGTSAVATYVVFRPDAPPLLRASSDDSSLSEVTPLVIEMESLARERLDGATPSVYFAPTDVPVPGALRGWSLAPPEGEGVQSESILFITGSVLALVTIEHPRGEEPFRPVEELAQIVYRRIQDQLD